MRTHAVTTLAELESEIREAITKAASGTFRPSPEWQQEAVRSLILSAGEVISHEANEIARTPLSQRDPRKPRTEREAG